MKQNEKRERIRGFLFELFSKQEAFDSSRLYAPVAGKAVAIAEVLDSTFSEGLLGAGVAIVPSDGRVYAPCDARVDTMFETGYAVSLDSVPLSGRP